MTYYAPDKAAALRAADRLNKLHNGRIAGARVVTRYIVDRYPYPGHTKWGVVERWRYTDRDDLPEMGGGFYWLTPDLWAGQKGDEQ